jgi:hypothetical protein
VKDILKRGIIVHTIMDRRIYTYNSVNSDLTQLLTLLMSMARANEESRVKGSRVADAWAGRRDTGEIVTGKVPGWLRIVPKSELTDPGEIEHAKNLHGDKAFTVQPHRLMLVRWMFEQVANGVSPHAVATMLNQRGRADMGPSAQDLDGPAAMDEHHDCEYHYLESCPGRVSGAHDPVRRGRQTTSGPCRDLPQLLSASHQRRPLAEGECHDRETEADA